MSHTPHGIRRLAVLAAASALALSGCALTQYHEARKARSAYARCMDRSGGDISACAAESDAYDRAVRRYEHASRRAWGCDPAQQECPTPR